MSKARQLADLGNQIDDGAVTGSNMVINGGLTVWQRGTSVTGAGSSGYSTADRWQHNASGGSLDLSQQSFALGQTDVPSQFKYFMRVACTTGNNNAGMWQKIEDVTSVQGTVTVSFYAKGTNPNGGEFELNIRQNFGSSGSTEVEQNKTFTVSSSWQRFTFVVQLEDISGKTVSGGNDYVWVYFRQPSADTSTNAWTLDFTGVCLNVGDSAIAFPHESYGDELALCQRYYQKSYQQDVAPSDSYVSGVEGPLAAFSANTAYATTMQYPVVMRTNPTITFYANAGTSGVAGKWAYYNGSRNAVDSIGVSAIRDRWFTPSLTKTSGFTAQNVYLFSGNYVLDAEL